MNALEAEFDLPPTTLSRLFSGERKTVELKTLPKLAAALRVSEMWLFKGEGQAPTLTGRFTSRRDQFGLEADFEELGEKINAMGGDATALARPRNNFEAAAQTLIFQLSEEAIAAVAAEAKGLEDSKPPHHWGKRLQEVEQEKRALRAPKAERTKSAQKKEAAPRSTPKVLPKRRAS
jgi:transcriptional regulator with XRE-family HTH domain